MARTRRARAVIAHDSRRGDLNQHHKHHYHKDVNFGLFWGFWDFLCGTRYNLATATRRGLALESVSVQNGGDVYTLAQFAEALEEMRARGEYVD